MTGACCALVLLLALVPAPAEARPRRPHVDVVVREAPAPLEAAAKAAAKAMPLVTVGTPGTRDLLLAIADHESSFNESIVHCGTLGDNGKAHGAYQLHPEAFGDHSAGEVCANDTLQAHLALVVLRQYMKAFPHLGIEGAVRGYASGNPRKDTPAAKEILAMWKARRAAHRGRRR